MKMEENNKDASDELSFEQLLNQEFARDEVQEGEIISAHVLSVDKDFVLVDIGYKSEGRIPTNEFPIINGEPQIKVGDKVEVLVETRENEFGHMVLSKEKADRLKVWDEISAACERDEVVEGVVIGRVKGGLQVDIGVRAFLPGSQVDLRPIRNLDKLIGERFKFRVIKFNKKRGNIVLSRRALLEKDREEKRKVTLLHLKEGAVMEGVVKNLTDYGAFVDLGGVDGLLHVTDMSWGRVQNPNGMFEVGQEVKVVVLKYDKDSERVSLGMKQTQEDPWQMAQKDFPVGMRVKGRVVSLTDYGAFIELKPGVEGLIHVSEMSWTKRVKHPSKIVNIGDEIEALVLDIDKENKRISLGMKQVEPNPWTMLEERYPVGTVIRGQVRNITDFGIFIGIEEGIDGLVHISDLSWTQRVKHPSELYQKNDEVEAVVLNIDVPNERFSLGIKQLHEDPWGRIPEVYPRGATVTGKVIKVTDFGAFIEIEPGIEGLCHVSELSEDHVEDPRTVVSPGDEVKVMIIDNDREERKIVLGKKELTNLIDKCYRLRGQKETVILCDRLRTLGYTEATKSGISIAMINMVIPERKKEILARCQEEVEEITNQYVEGLITDGERYNKVVDIWSKAAEEIAEEMMKSVSTTEIVSDDGKERKITPSFNPLYIMADSGARGSTQQMKQLAGMRGLMAKPSGEIIETPITANFREGLTVHQYFNSTHGARKGLADTALKTANSGYLTRRLVDVAQDSIITEYDCGTFDGIEITPLVEGNDIIEAIGDRILGRVVLEDVADPVSGEVLIEAGREVDEGLVAKVEDAGISRVRIRSVLTCQTRRGICVQCYGRDLSRGHLVNVGEAIGVIAAQSIGEPGTQLTMQTFHIGGIASGSAEQSSHECRGEGRVVFENLEVVKRRDGKSVTVNRQGEVKIVDETGREREVYPAAYGSVVNVNEGDWVKPGTKLVEWDPYSAPILTEASGVATFGDLVEGVSMVEQVDEGSGLSHKVVVEGRDPNARPRITVKDSEGNVVPVGSRSSVARYILPVGAVILVNEGQNVEAGDVLAKVSREASRTKDITGGLPRVVELFEARRPKDYAVIAEISGSVSFGKDTKGKRKVIIAPEMGEAREYLIPKGKHIRVREGDFIRAGEPLMDGSVNPHDILNVLGEKALAKYLVEEIQEVYRLQGVRINDKHIETIVRQMLRRVRIKDSGDTRFLTEEQVEKQVFETENERILHMGGQPAVAEPLLLGITKASLSTESFISGASFQETTKVLTEAAVSSKVDYLRGLKENVIMGRLVPAGTGLPNYRYLNVQIDDSGVINEGGLMESVPIELLEGV